MRMTELFTKTKKNAPTDEQSKNAQLLIRAGFIYKEMAGVYAFLPLGKKVLDNIVQIIREEMNKVGGSEISLTALQNKEVWEKSGRWSEEEVDVWFKTTLLNGTDLGLGFTHEEPLTVAMKNFISSYNDLPAYPYQFQTKFRNEVRAKSGLMRGREFLMKDMYSFSRDRLEHEVFYEKATDAYHAIFNRLGIGDITFKTFASGGSFSRFSHEFQTLSPVGEDTIYVHREKGLAINDEVFNDDVLQELGLRKEELVQEKAVEVGNIFTLGARFSDPLELSFTDKDGQVKSVFMGSYGIGPSRLMGLLAEHFSDDLGLVWPENVAPAKVYIVRIGGTRDVIKAADELYEQLQSADITVLYDDRKSRPGEKFADCDLFGIPHRVVISDKVVQQNKIEYKQRQSEVSKNISKDELFAIFS